MPCCLPLFSTASAPRMNNFSRLNTLPTCTPVNASPTTSRMPAHDSEPSRLARPSTYRTFICNHLPVFPAHVAVGTTISRRPPHRSRRAALPHRALALGHDAEAHIRQWVAKSSRWQPGIDQPLHLFPCQLAGLASPPKRAVRSVASNRPGQEEPLRFRSVERQEV